MSVSERGYEFLNDLNQNSEITFSNNHASSKLKNKVIEFVGAALCLSVVTVSPVAHASVANGHLSIVHNTHDTVEQAKYFSVTPQNQEDNLYFGNYKADAPMVVNISPDVFKAGTKCIVKQTVDNQVLNVRKISHAQDVVFKMVSGDNEFSAECQSSLTSSSNKYSVNFQGMVYEEDKAPNQMSKIDENLLVGLASFLLISALSIPVSLRYKKNILENFVDKENEEEGKIRSTKALNA